MERWFLFVVLTAEDLGDHYGDVGSDDAIGEVR